MLKTSAAIEKFIADFNPPEGFKKESVEYDYGWYKETDKLRQLVLTNDKDEIKIEMTFYVCSTEYEKEQHGKFSYSGHTHFNSAKGWLTFDRTGVEDSFYGGEKVSDWEKPLDQTIQYQLEKIAKSRERAKQTITLPKIGFSRTPEEIESIKISLKKGGQVHFFPSGFGTGYIVTVKKTRYNQSIPELAKFLGFENLYYETFDHD